MTHRESRSASPIRRAAPKFRRPVTARATALLVGAGLTTASLLAAAEVPPLALVGGTLVDLSSFGAGGRDLADSVVLVAGGRVVAAGARGEVEIPAGARRLDISGKFVLPGLIDGFAGLNSAGQAKAYLYSGVTSIVGVSDGRRGPLALGASPRPRVFPLEQVGYDEKNDPEVSPEAVRARIDELARSGVRVLLLMYPLPPEGLAAALERARELGLATIGELGATPYPEALALGVQAFVHTSRYSLALAPEATRRAVAEMPFGPPKLAYYRSLISTLAGGPAVEPWARRLGRSSTALIPTLAMEYLDLPGHANPWLEPAAKLLDPKGIHLPADPATGERAERAEAGADAFPAELAGALVGLEKRYAAAGARYLAGSGTSAFGTMPGISLHHELELLVKVGLTPRQAIAAASANYREIYGWRELGSVAPGCVADLLVVARDPTVDLAALREIELLVVDGALLDRPGLLRP